MAKSKVNDLSVLEEMLQGNTLGLDLLQKARFMQETLKKLEAEVNEGGVITVMPQGAYSIERANPALQAYNITIKNYTTIIKQLNDMLPVSKVKNDGFEDF